MGKSRASHIKHTFFNSAAEQASPQAFKDEDFNLTQLRAEFFSLWAVFESNQEQWKSCAHELAYMYYLCNFLMRYYQHDYVRNDLTQLQKKKSTLEAYIQSNATAAEQEAIKSFSLRLLAKTTPIEDNKVSPLAVLPCVNT